MKKKTAPAIAGKNPRNKLLKIRNRCIYEAFNPLSCFEI
jgi:hypothetical protein